MNKARKVKKRSTFKRSSERGGTPDLFKRKTIKAQNSKQTMLKGYV
jgi:hypothetical protein